jgi:hypothetical protein
VTAGDESEGIKCFTERGSGNKTLDGKPHKNKPVLRNKDNSLSKDKDRKKKI